MITQELVKELFKYKDGELYWKISNGKVKIGNKAGCSDTKGYLRTTIKGKLYKNHQIIFLMFYGYIPKITDHINGIKYDNRIENLREAKLSQNAQNAKMPKTNTSGVKGVSWNKRAKKWHVQLHVNGELKYFGRYYCIQFAEFVANIMRHKYHGEFANNGRI